jgi:hypothetical protein
MTATKTEAPMIDHRIPKGCPLMWTTKGSDSLSWVANQGPRSAPMKPRAIETISPPRTSPAIALPMAPHTAAIMMRSMSPGNVMVMTGPFLLEIDPASVKTLYSLYPGWE